MPGYEFIDAERVDTPLILGLIGPSTSGKTRSALRLATGIVSVTGGNIVCIDTEQKRMLRYARTKKDVPQEGKYAFKYLNFSAPHTSIRYKEIIALADKEANGGCIIVDSVSHEHDGDGGYLEYCAAEVERLKCRSEKDLRQYAEPSKDRRRLIQKITTLNSSIILCFRAQEKIKPGKNLEGKTIIRELGWQPIGGAKFIFEITTMCLLTPNSKGVPDWSDESFKLGSAKLDDDFKGIFTEGRQLDEKCGEEVARLERSFVPTIEKISEEELIEMKMEIVGAESTDDLKLCFGKAYTKAKRSNDEFAMTQLKAEYDKHNLQLSGTS